MSTLRKTQVVIVGAGMAGLTCAVELERRGVDFVLLEASDRVGGRVATDHHQGFLLDRGFQVLLTAYPEVRRLWNYHELKLRMVRSGAIIRHQGGWRVLPDPLKEPSQLWSTLRSPVGNLLDKLQVGRLSLQSLFWNEKNCFVRSPESTREWLGRQGFSPAMMALFWRPFFGGVFLDDELQTGTDLFRFLFSLFVRGRVALPLQGMEQLPLQLQRRLDPGRVQLNTRILGRDGRRCWDAEGNQWEGEHLVVALDGASGRDLLGLPSAPLYHGTHCSYFAAPQSPGGQGRLQLNAQRDSCIHHLLVLSDVSPDYAPPGEALVSVSSQTPDLPSEGELKRELSAWYGAEQVQNWRLLRQYSLPSALPRFQPGQRFSDLKLEEGLWRCGDYLLYPSLNAAVQSGRIVAESLGYGPPK